MDTIISFYEVSLKNCELLVRLGSGLSDDIMNRQHLDPSIRICVQEPCNEAAILRVRYGSAEMTDSGPKPLPHDNDAEARGAWIRVLPLASRVFGVLNGDCQRRQLAECIGVDIKTGWIEIEGDSVKRTDVTSIRNVLGSKNLSNPEDKVFVRFGGINEQISQILSLIQKEFKLVESIC